MRQKTIPATPERTVNEDVSLIEFNIQDKSLNVIIRVGETTDEDGELVFENEHAESFAFRGADLRSIIQTNPTAFRGVRDAILDAVEERRNV